MGLWLSAILCLFGGMGVLTAKSQAEPVVFANRTRNEVTLQLTTIRGGQARLEVPSHESKVLFVNGRFFATFAGLGRKLEINPGSAYFIGADVAGKPGLHQIGLGTETVSLGKKGGWATHAEQPGKPLRLPVLIYVDDDQRRTDNVWRKDYGDRIAEASAALVKLCGIGFDVVGYGRWDSDDKTTDLNEAILEFEREAAVKPGQTAIGFTSQFQWTRGRTHMGGSHGPFQRHVILRDWPRDVDAAEQKELLLHELGHLLGATHSVEADSVMRPVVGRSTSGGRVQLKFDPINALILASVSEDIRTRNAQRVRDLSGLTRLRLHKVYSTLEQAMPQDPAAARLAAIVKSGDALSELAVQHVCEAISNAADQEIQRRQKSANGKTTPNVSTKNSDELAVLQLREAARAATQLPQQDAPRAFLLGLGLMLDRDHAIMNSPLRLNSLTGLSILHRSKELTKTLGPATLRGDGDQLQRFVITAGLTVLLGADEAEEAAIANEIRKAQAEQGFSFDNIQAAIAGAHFARQSLAEKHDLGELSESGRFADFCPAPQSVNSSLDRTQFAAKYGGFNDPRFKKELAAIRHRVQRDDKRRLGADIRLK